MITATYGLSGLLLFAVAGLFGAGILTAWTQTACWIAIFFIASAAASSAYLTASEIFPLETRAMAIALFYALGTLLGGVTAPFLFGQLIGYWEGMGRCRRLRYCGGADGWRGGMPSPFSAWKRRENRWRMLLRRYRAPHSHHPPDNPGATLRMNNVRLCATSS